METQVFDNNGETYDRYTIVVDGAMFGASEDPFHPQGFGQYYGEFPGGNTEHLGKPVKREELPEPVQRYIGQLEEKHDN